MKSQNALGALLVLSLVATACGVLPGKPTVVIASPPHGSAFREGEKIVVYSTAADSVGVVRVELVVDGVTVRTDSTPNPQGLPSFTFVQTWKATQGTHTIAVRAYNTAGMASDPAAVSISVSASSSVAPPTEPPMVFPSTPTTRAVSPTPTLTTGGDPYADRVVSFTPGNPTNPQFGNTQSVLGPPDFNAAALTGFLNLGIGGSVTVEFVNNVAVDGPGPDIEIVGDPGNDEQWTVEVSADCVNYKSFGKVQERVKLDLATVALTAARCVRLTGNGDPRGISPGPELDAVVALNSAAPGVPPPLPPTAPPALSPLPPPPPPPLPFSFTFSPKSGPGGTEVQLYLSAPLQVEVFYNGRLLPKKVSPDGKTLTVTIPAGAASGYFELRWDGQSVKASEQFMVIFQAPPAP